MKRKIQVLCCALFCGFIGIFAVLNIIKPEKTFSMNENRYLKKFPKFSLNELFYGDYTTDLESYVTDHFIFRDEWISVKSLTKQLTGSIENNGVYFGKNNQLFQMFSNSDMSTVNQSLEYINRFVQANDIPVDLMLVPTASEIEGSSLPVFAYNEKQEGIIDDITTKFIGNSIDVYSALSGSNDVFFNLDHHWNEKGALIAYLTYMDALGEKPEDFSFEKVSDDFKGTLYSKAGTFWYNGEPLYKMMPNHQIDSTVTFEDGTSMDSLFSDKYLTLKDKYSYYLDGNHALVRIKNEGVENSLGKLLVIKDSYGHILIPYLASHYDEVVVVDLRYYRDSISNLIKEEGVTRALMVYNIENFLTDKNFAFLK
ncbi:DHHW family protein [Anaerorhabdus sp.]|jgi:hypothetical protein|uniref:DHHW family protein n=1 Tax=Anaerorhabdus sp. TaxID=1872524 RepID=UPI002FC634F7